MHILWKAAPCPTLCTSVRQKFMLSLQNAALRWSCMSLFTFKCCRRRRFFTYLKMQPSPLLLQLPPPGGQQRESGQWSVIRKGHLKCHVDRWLFDIFGFQINYAHRSLKLAVNVTLCCGLTSESNSAPHRHSLTSPVVASGRESEG